MEVGQACFNCTLQSDQITSGEFNCLTDDTPDQVTYRANLRGNTDSDCDSIIETIQTWVQSSRASISIQGTRLSIASNCEVAVETFTSPLECVPVTTTAAVTTLGIVSSEGVSVPLVAGAAVGGVLVLIVILVVVIVCVSFMSSRRKRKR